MTQSEAFQVCFIIEPEEELFLKQSNKRMNNLPATIVNAKSVIEFQKIYDDVCGSEKYNYEYA